MSHGQRLSSGRIVHFVMGDGSVRPAQVVRVWGQDPRGSEIAYDEGNPQGMYACANLLVFLDGENDAQYNGTHEAIADFIKRRIDWLTENDGMSRKHACKQVAGEAQGAVYGNPIHYLSYVEQLGPDDAKTDQVHVNQVCAVNGWLGWATSVAYDPYDWQPRTWHWPQDEKRRKPGTMEPVATI